MIEHKITVNKRLIAYAYANRHDECRTQRKQLIKLCIMDIRRLQDTPSPPDMYDNPTH